MTGLILQFGYEYTDQHRTEMSTYTDLEALIRYLKKQRLVDQFANFADKHGLKRRNLMIQRSYHLLDQYVTSRVVYGMLDEAALIEYLNQDDDAIRQALSVFANGEAFPQPGTALNEK